jgi:hypothetical protein
LLPSDESYDAVKKSILEKLPKRESKPRVSLPGTLALELNPADVE